MKLTNELKWVYDSQQSVFVCETIIFLCMWLVQHFPKKSCAKTVCPLLISIHRMRMTNAHCFQTTNVQMTIFTHNTSFVLERSNLSIEIHKWEISYVDIMIQVFFSLHKNVAGDWVYLFCELYKTHVNNSCTIFTPYLCILLSVLPYSTWTVWSAYIMTWLRMQQCD